MSRLLGEGGMAKVYEAIVNERLGTKVAVKILHPNLALHPGIRQRFEQEAMSMAQLHHPYIARVIDYEDEGDHLAMIMEYLEGETLRDRIYHQGAMEARAALRIFGKVLDACQYVHDKGIVHRDIKPSNIYLTMADEPKVLDFGIAKLLESDAVKTRTGVQIGTPIYMSPEQVKTPKDVDHRTDIYSLGVSLHHMISGTPPYDQATHSEWEIQTKIVQEPLPQIAGVPKRLNDIIQQATAKEQEQRYQSCAEFKDAFRFKPGSNRRPASEKTRPISQPKGPPEVSEATIIDAPLPKPEPISQPQGIGAIPPPEIRQDPPKLNKQALVIPKEAMVAQRRYRKFMRNYIFGLLFIAIGIIFAMTEEPLNIAERQTFGILLFIAGMFLLLAGIHALRLLHKGWQSVQDRGAYTTPGKAIGFLFIPLFNLYWIFVTFRQLAVEMNQYARDRQIGTGKLVSEGMAISICIFILPVINYVGIFINVFLYPNFLRQIRDGVVSIYLDKQKP
ncbi:MAG: serine/threonine-protein kinase [Bacteroidota bacterium]